LIIFGILKNNSEDLARHITWGFMQVGQKERTMGSGAYPSFGSGRSFSIGHLNIFFYICFSIGSGSEQMEY
jgi:hypothetical protein